jgi:hypothetical protein
MNNLSVTYSDSVKISASGYIHLRVLAERIEYLHSILPTTRIDDVETVDIVVDVVKRENALSDIRACLQLTRERMGIGRRTFCVSDRRGIPESANV